MKDIFNMESQKKIEPALSPVLKIHIIIKGVVKDVQVHKENS